MRPRFATTFLIVLTSLALPAMVGAQARVRDRARVGVSGGAVFLAGRDRDLHGNGQSASVNVLIPIDDKGFSIRVDALRLAAPGRNHRVLVDPTADSVTVGNLSSRAATVSAVLGPTLRTLPVRPFLSVGGGVHHVRLDASQAGADASESTTSFAVVYGIGATFPLWRVRGLVEARAYTLYWDSGALHVYPVTIGLLF